MSILLYAWETWTITADIERRIHALEVRCFLKFIGISYRYHITNEEVKARIGNAIGLYEDLLTSVKRLKLKWYGNWSGTGTSHYHLDWPRVSYREQFKEGDEEAERGNDGKTTSKSGLALNKIHYYGKPKTARSGGSWLQNLQWCPNGQPDYGIDKISFKGEGCRGKCMQDCVRLNDVHLICFHPCLGIDVCC